MYKNFTKHGNSYAVVIDKPIMELLGMSPETTLELTTNGSALTITPVRDAKRRKTIEESLERANKRFGKVFKKLSE
jgi:antitoxin MazE